MTSELDIWRSAKLLFDHRRADALLFAAKRADEMLARGDMAAQAVCKRITAAVEELTRRKPKQGERAN